MFTSATLHGLIKHTSFYIAVLVWAIMQFNFAAPKKSPSAIPVGNNVTNCTEKRVKT